MSVRNLVVTLVVTAVVLIASRGVDSRAAEADPRPNLVLILADDLGYECIGADGGASYRTPVLDRLAATGMRFDHCYVQPLCTPTRVQLMTGLYNVRNYISFGQMDPDATTFAKLLQQAGYATCMAGKWQLGTDPALPKRFGFDEYCLWQHTRRPPRYANPGLEINGVEKDFTSGQYGPDLVDEFARDFVSRHQRGPFLLYYTLMLTHDPYQPTPDSPDWDPKARGESVNRAPRHFGEMVAYMDKLIGKLIVRLEELHIRDRTLVLFLGDNGTGRGARSLLGGRMIAGGKGSTSSAGMHVPLIVNWPGRIPPGRISGDLVDGTDFFPTLCEAAGIGIPRGLDGQSFYAQLTGKLTGKSGGSRTWSYCWYSPRGEPVQEFAFNPTYRLNRDATVVRFDDGRPVDRSQLDPKSTAALRALQFALDRYANARPARFSKLAAKAARRNAAQTP